MLPWAFLHTSLVDIVLILEVYAQEWKSGYVLGSFTLSTLSYIRPTG